MGVSHGRVGNGSSEEAEFVLSGEGVSCFPPLSVVKGELGGELGHKGEKAFHSSMCPSASAYTYSTTAAI